MRLMSSRSRSSTSELNRCTSSPVSQSCGRFPIQCGTSSAIFPRVASTFSASASVRFPIRSVRGTPAWSATISAIRIPIPLTFVSAYTTDRAPSRSVFARRTMYRKFSFASGGRTIAFGAGAAGASAGGVGSCLFSAIERSPWAKRRLQWRALFKACRAQRPEDADPAAASDDFRVAEHVLHLPRQGGPALRGPDDEPQGPALEEMGGRALHDPMDDRFPRADRRVRGDVVEREALHGRIQCSFADIRLDPVRLRVPAGEADRASVHV